MKHRAIQLILLAGVAFIIASCAQIAQVRDFIPLGKKPLRDSKKDNYYIYVTVDSANIELGGYLKDEIDYIFPQYHVNANIYLDESGLEKQKREKVPYLVLKMKQVEPGVFVANFRNDPGYSGMKFVVNVYDEMGKKRIWRDNIELSPSWESFAFDSIAEEIVGELLEKMVREKLI